MVRRATDSAAARWRPGIPMANGNGRRVTSGQRVVAAAALADRARLSLAETSMWADALALMVEDGQEDAPRVLLARVTDELTAERVRSALLGRMGSADEQLAQQAVDVPGGELPPWAEAGIIDPAGRPAYSRHTLDLDAACPGPPCSACTREAATVSAASLAGP